MHTKHLHKRRILCNCKHGPNPLIEPGYILLDNARADNCLALVTNPEHKQSDKDVLLDFY